jgi:hypothetical protein
MTPARVLRAGWCLGKNGLMEEIRWRSADLEAAAAEATGAQKLVLIDFYSPT